MDAKVPKPGEWPVDPQEDVPVREERIWIDGCFDFFHHGHAGVMLQARQLGNELYVGIHSDEDIQEHKGPTVMNLKERVAAADACRWTTKSVPHSPYVTQLPWLTHYGCKYVVHGDDITSDSGGEDTYRFAKQAKRFKVVKRTPGISTTDLVGRMLLYTKGHFIRSLSAVLEGQEGAGSFEERIQHAEYMKERFRSYATDESGLQPGADVYIWSGSSERPGRDVNFQNKFEPLVKGKGPISSQRIVYVDGGFDLFCSGHIEFLRSVVEKERAEFGEPFTVVGMHDDEVINKWKGLNYPIMNIFERGLCIIQCTYVNSVIFGAPYEPNADFLKSLPYGLPSRVYHGPTSFMGFDIDPYKEAKELGIFEEIPKHDFQNVNAGHIVERITGRRSEYEARQRQKGVKAAREDEVRKLELEQEAEIARNSSTGTA